MPVPQWIKLLFLFLAVQCLRQNDWSSWSVGSNWHILGTLRTPSDSSSVSGERHNSWVRGIGIWVPCVSSCTWYIVQSLRGESVLGESSQKAFLHFSWLVDVPKILKDDVAWRSMAWGLPAWLQRGNLASVHFSFLLHEGNNSALWRLRGVNYIMHVNSHVLGTRSI